MTTQSQRMMLAYEKRQAEIKALKKQVTELEREVAVWKDRWEAADQALQQTIKDYENERNEAPQ